MWLRIEMPLYTVLVDEDGLNRFCRTLVGPDARRVRLASSWDPPEHMQGSIHALYQHEEGTISLYGSLLFQMMAKTGPQIHTWVAHLLAHELSHYLCMNYPGRSPRRHVHNWAAAFIKWLVGRFPDGVPTQGIESMPLAYYDVARSVRERIADSMADELLEQHGDELLMLIAVHIENET